MSKKILPPTRQIMTTLLSGSRYFYSVAFVGILIAYLFAQRASEAPSPVNEVSDAAVAQEFTPGVSASVASSLEPKTTFGQGKDLLGEIDVETKTVNGKTATVYKNMYAEGIDTRFYLKKANLGGFDLVANPGSDPESVQLCLENMTGVHVNPQGELVIPTGHWYMISDQPKAYQQTKTGEQVELSCSFKVVGECLSFDIGDYNPDLEVYIDPGLFRAPTQVAFDEKIASVCGPDIGDQAEVVDYFNGTNWILVFDIQAQLNGYGYCNEIYNSGAPIGEIYTVVNPDNDPDFPHSDTQEDDITACLNGLSDPAINSDPNIHYHIPRAMWALSGDLDPANLYGSGEIIYNNVLNGTYQPVVNAVWLKPTTTSVQYMITMPAICSDGNDPFDFVCADGVTVECEGKGTEGQSNAAITLTNGATADSIHVIAVHKGGAPPTVVEFETDDGQYYMAPAETTTNAPGGNSCSTCRVYKAIFAGGASTINMDANGSLNIYSLYAFVFSTTGNSTGTTSGIPVDEYFYKGTNTYVIPLEPQDGPRDVTIKVPVTELTDDSRIIDISATAGGVSDNVQYNTFDPVLGSSLRFATLTLHNVPSSATSVSVTIDSPDSGGDSFLVGGYVTAETECVTISYDYGDAPASYGDFGIATDTGSPAYFGVQPDAEAGSQYDVDAEGDDNADQDDEDGVTFVGGTALQAGSTKTIEINWSSNEANSYIFGWIDFNGDGDFDTDERVINNEEVGSGTFGVFATGTETFQVHVPADVTCGISYARFYIHTDQNIPVTGLYDSDGEVEDYQVTIEGCPTPTDPPEDETFACGDDMQVELIGVGANCDEVTTVGITNSGNVTKYAVEIVYKGDNPGSSVIIEEADGDLFSLDRIQPSGTSSNVWVYRGIINGSTSSITYTDTDKECKLQSVVVYAYRSIPGAPGTTVQYTAISGYRSTETIDYTIPAGTSPRDVTLRLPISELTLDCRLLYITADADGITETILVDAPDTNLGDCCLNIPTITLENVPGDVTDLVITVVSPNGSGSGCPSQPTHNGQSYVIAGLIEAEIECTECALDPPVVNVHCDDNGTPSDPSDDTFTYTIEVTGSDTGDSYLILGDDSQSNLHYGMVEGPFGPFPISGGNLDLIVEDVDDKDCTVNVEVVAPAPCSDQCDLDPAVITATCDDNGTPSDPSDDTFTYTIEVNGVNTGASYSISGDDTQSGLAYGVVNGPFGPFPISGGNLTIHVTDSDDSGCGLDEVVGAPATCSDNCELNTPVITATCDDNGTPSDPSDDTFTYTIKVTGSNTGNTYSISGDDTQTGLAYGVTQGPFGPFPISGGDRSIVIKDGKDDSCTEPATVNAPATCSDVCDLDDPIITATCDDNGTPSDPSDDTFTYTIEVTGSNTSSSYKITGDDAQNSLSYGVVEGPFGPFPISGGNLVIHVSDTDDSNCRVDNVVVNAPATCSGQCDLDDPIVQTFCNDNGTPSNPNDDTYTYFITVTGSNTGATYSISGDDTQSNLSYGANEGPFGPFPISGGDLSLTITDSDNGNCQASATADAPASCSDVCNLNAPSIIATCDDNGTPSDSSDDTFTYTIEVTGSNTSASYSISGDDIQSGLAYGVVNGPFGPFPISNGNLVVIVSDDDDADCKLVGVQVTAPGTCSDDCELFQDPTILVTCDDNGTPSDSSDDTFTYQITVTGSNQGTTYNITGDDAQSNLAYNTANGPFGPFPISGGDLTIMMTDNDDPSCNILTEIVEAPATCSDLCDLDPAVVVASCDDNGTPSDPSDDTFTYTIEVMGSNTGATYSISGDDTQSGLAYGVVNGPFGPFPINGGDLMLDITDSDDISCGLEDVAVNAPGACSDQCSIDPPVILTNCDDNGTPTNPNDDTFTYLIQATGTNNGATYSISGDDTQTGLDYDVLSGPFGPFPISGGNLSITLSDDDNSGCTRLVLIDAPQPCSELCDLEVPMILTFCSDNGTPSDPSDDTFTYTIEVSGNNTGSAYNITGDDTQSNLAYDVTNGPFGPFPISGGNLILTIVDADDPSCQTLGVASAPPTCSDRCDLDQPVILTFCDDNGTPSDDSDDTFSYTIQVLGSNTSATYNITGDDLRVGLAYNIINGPYGPFPLTGGDLNITVTDNDDVTCSVNAVIDAPDACSDQCNLDPPTIMVTCFDSGTPSDPSDDSFTYTIELTGTNTSTTYGIFGDDTQNGLLYGVVNGPYGPFPINNGNLSLTLTDDSDPNCQLIGIDVIAPQTCSDVCDLDNPIISAQCDDNGTPSDPSDDTFTYTVQVTGSNTSGTYEITGDDSQSGLSYGVVNGPFGPFPISGGDLNITIADSGDANCALPNETVTAPASCSGVCNLDTPVVTSTCDDNGTPADASDDTFSYTIQVTGSNTGATYSVSGDDSQSGLQYGIVYGPFGPFPISGGFLVINVTDDTSPNCEVSNVVVNTPASCNVPSDFGDAPDTYQDAGNEIDEDLTLGENVDDEPGTQNSTDADGDDNGNSDDEDAVTFLTADGGCFGTIGTDQMLEVEVRNNTGSTAFLSAWIDFNGNGTFDNGEEIINNYSVASAAGIQTIQFTYSIPGNAVAGDTYARFRISENTITGAGGVLQVIGEVEDYACTINGQEYDHGDNPASYGDFAILTDAGTPSSLGGAPDDEPAAQSTVNADGDDNDGLDDENGVSFVGGTTLTPGTDKEIGISWTTYDEDAYIYGYIDFNGDGDFDPAEEVIAEFPVGSGTTGVLDSGNEIFTVSVPSNAKCGQTYARFYIHDDTGIAPVGIYNVDGEVEDYAVTIESTVEITTSADVVICLDDNTTISASASGGTGPYTFEWDNGLGTGSSKTVSPDETTTYNVTVTDANMCTATGSVTVTVKEINSDPIVVTFCDDNNTPSDPTDDTFTYTIQVTGENVGASYSISGDDAQSGLSYNLVNGPFGPFPISGGDLSITITDSEVPACQVVDVAVEAPMTCSGVCNLDPPVIETVCNDNGTPSNPNDDFFTYTIELTGSNTGSTYSISGDDTQSGLAYGVENGPFGPFSMNGPNLLLDIVDDTDPSCQLINIVVAKPEACDVQTDFGDSPDSYMDAGNEVDEDLTIGEIVDDEPDSQNSNDAKGDDNGNSDDEDGVTFLTTDGGCFGTAGSEQTVEVDVFNNTGNTAYLSAWIDFNGNGVFDDPSEAIISNYNVANNATTQTLTFTYTIPGNATSGLTYARFRISADLNPAPTGVEAVIGEVEDYACTIDDA
jgi:hypothetical protein